MQYRNLGRTGLKVSNLCLGGNVFGWTADQEASEGVLDTYAEAGGNFVDTADIYTRWIDGHIGGESERVLGQWLQERGNRDQVVIATKCAGGMGDGPNDKGLSRAHIVHAAEASLIRLKTDYIDLYQAHFDDPETPLDETLGAFSDLVAQGKVRYLGASNYSAWRLMKSFWESDKNGLSRFDSLQPLYNLVDREPYEKDLEAVVQDQKIGVIPYFSLAAGFLTGKYKRDAPLPDSPRAINIQKKYMNDRGFAIMDSVTAVAEQLSVAPAQVALAWLIARPSVTAPIASATSVEQAKDLVAAASLTLEQYQIDNLNKASDWTTEHP